MSRYHNGRGWAYWRLRSAWFAGMLRDGIVAVPCSWCGQLVDLTLTGSGTMARSVDHGIALSKGGPLLDVSTWRVMHKGCNVSKGTRPIQARPMADVAPSRQW